MREIIKLGIRLMLFTLIAGLALGGVYVLTEEPIAQQTIIKDDAARKAVLPGVDAFEEMTGDALVAAQSASTSASLTQAYAGYKGDAKAGYTFKLLVKGYGGNVELTVGIDTEGVVTGVSIGTHSETPGLGAKATDPSFLNQFVGKTEAVTVVKTPPQKANEVQAISGATITSRAVSSGVNEARNAYRALAEGGY